MSPSSIQYGAGETDGEPGRGVKSKVEPPYWSHVVPSVIIVGGGLAGLASAAALGGAGFDVDLFEARGFLGGRAASFPLSPSDENSEVIDNCQHILLRCCVNLLDFYERLGVRDRIVF